jgi:hypothetical protein
LTNERVELRALWWSVLQPRGVKRQALVGTFTNSEEFPRVEKQFLAPKAQLQRTDVRVKETLLEGATRPSVLGECAELNEGPNSDLEDLSTRSL